MNDKQVVPDLGLTLADDYLPPASLHNLSDTELKNNAALWPWPYFRKHRSHPKNKNVPATVTTLKKGTFTHSAEWVEHWADNCALAWYGVWSYKSLKDTPDWDHFLKLWLWLSKGTEVITNGKGIENGYYDPVSGINPGSKPIGIDSLHMERNVFKPANLQPQRIGGQTGYLFWTLDGTLKPPDIHKVNCLNSPWYWSRANIIMADEQRGPDGNLYPYLPNGHLGLDPFPQGWGSGLDAITPLPVICMPLVSLGAGVNLIPENRVHLTDGKLTIINYVPNAFNPERF